MFLAVLMTLLITSVQVFAEEIHLMRNTGGYTYSYGAEAETYNMYSYIQEVYNDGVGSVRTDIHYFAVDASGGGPSVSFSNYVRGTSQSGKAELNIRFPETISLSEQTSKYYVNEEYKPQFDIVLTPSRIISYKLDPGN